MSRLKLLLFSYTSIPIDWDFLCESSTSCMLMFFIGCCLTLNLSELPNALWTLLMCVFVGLVSLRWYRVRAMAFLMFGFAWACYSFQSFSSVTFPDDYERADFVVFGSVEGLPISRAGNTQFRFKVNEVVDQNLSMLISKRVQLSCYRCSLSINAGDQWQLTLRVKRPHGYASWGVFDYEKYLYRHKVVAKGYVRLKGINQRLSTSTNTIHTWRQSILESLHEVIGNGVGGNIIVALTIGVKTRITDVQNQVFQTTGVSHLMAISGLHVGLVFMGVSILLKWLFWPVARVFEYYPRQRIVLLPALSAAFLYAALAGFSISTQRALLMLAVYVICKFCAREVGLAKVLLLAITCLLLIDPFSILDMGFWLSCSAVAVIALASSNVGQSDTKERTQGSINQGSWSSELLVAKTPVKPALSLFHLQPMLWIGMLPLSVMFFGQVSLVSPFVNLIVVPLFCILLIPATLLSVLIFCLGMKTVGAWCLLLLSDVFEVVYWSLDIVSQQGFAKIYATPMVWWQWLFFILLIACYRKSVRSSVVMSVLLICSVFIKTSTALAKDQLNVTLLDVGQGLAMVVETANSVTVYDTGPRYGTGFTAAEAVLLPFLRQRGVRFIDTLVISHADNDHIGGLSKLRDAFPIGSIITSRLDKVNNAKECLAGQSWRYDDTVFRVISPDVDTPSGSNNRSCVIMLEHQGVKVMLSGDIEKQVERFLVNKSKYLLKADILLVPHQGSKTSSTESFVEAVSPNIAMLAAGYKNHYGHPHPSVVNRYHSKGIELLSTIDHGSVMFEINSQGWSKVLYRQRYKRFWHYQKLPTDSS